MRGRILLIASALQALTACQMVHVEHGGDHTFNIRYDRLKHGSLDADVAANRQCHRGTATLVSDTTGDGGAKVRNYRCTRFERRH